MILYSSSRFRQQKAGLESVKEILQAISAKAGKDGTRTVMGADLMSMSEAEWQCFVDEVNASLEHYG